MLCFIFVLSLLFSASAFTAVRFSTIQQCGPFNVTFSGSQPTALPLTLTVVPFGSSAAPLSIPLPNPEWDSERDTGVAITFLPYPAEATFIASLDDAKGQSTGFTSDIIRILPSDNTSCVSTVEQTQSYTPKPPFSQCQPFNVTFDPTQAIPPMVRLFVPNGQALLLNQTRVPTDPGTSSFTMVAFRGQPAVLLLRDGSDRLQSTNLLTVTGDTTSSNNCFPNPPEDLNKYQQAGLSRQAVIGIVASIATVVTLLSILVAVHFFLRYRRSGRTNRAMQRKGIQGGPGFVNPGDTPHPDPQPVQSSWNAITIINKPTPYPMEKFTSRPISPYSAQLTPNRYAPGRYQQMQSLNAATADLDQILNASVFASNDGNRTWSSSLSPSTPHSRDIRSPEPSSSATEQSKVVSPASPLSYTSDFRDSIVPASYIREGSTEADPGAGNEGGGNTTRRSSTTVFVFGQGVMDRSGQDGHGGPNL